MKIVIAGSRSVNDESKVRTLIHKTLQKLNITPTEIISGNANGADKIGESYARMMEIPLGLYPADWNRHGKSAGVIRNKVMAKLADVAIVFWDGESRGTKNMISEMSKLDKLCVVYII